jgi:hypothetical protein
MKAIARTTVAAVLAVLLAACSSGGQPSADKSPQGGIPGPGAPSASATPTPATSASGAATTIDPCQLVTAAEASTLTGVTYTSGKLEVDSVSSRRCIYGGQTKHVFEVIVAQAASPAAAKAYATALRAQAEQLIGASVALSAVTGIGDDAETLHATKSGIDMAGLYVVKGANGFALVDETLGTAASIPALETQAQTVLSRLP